MSLSLPKRLPALLTQSVALCLSVGYLLSSSPIICSPAQAQSTNAGSSPEQNFQAGQITQAIQQWSREIQNNQNLSSALYNRSQAYILIKQYTLALRDLDRLLTLEGKRVSANTLVLRGIALSETNQLPAAIESFNQAIAQQASSLAYNNRAIAYQKMGQLPLALADLEKSVQLSPITSHQLNLANLQIQLGQNQQAAQMMTQTITQDNKFFPAYVTRGIATYNLGAFEAALRDFTVALQIQPEQPEAFYYAGLAFNQLKRKPDAAKSMLRAAELYLQRNQAELYQQVLDKMTELKLQ